MQGLRMLVAAGLVAGGLVADAYGAAELKVQLYGSSYGNNNGSSLSATGPITRSSAGVGSIGSATSRGSSDFGVLKSYTQSSAIAGSSSFNNLVMSTSELHFADDFNIDAAGLTGTNGTLKVKFTIDGSLSASQPQVDPSFNQSYASASYHLSVPGGYGLVKSASQAVNADGTTEADGAGPFLGIEQSANVPFTFGTPFTLRLTVGSGAMSYTKFGGTALADLEHTAEWGGFEAVLNGSGSPISGYSFSSTSGTNYVAAVPEPGTAGLVLLGVAGGMLRFRPRRDGK